MSLRPRVNPDRIRTVNPAACVFCIALLATGSALAQAVRPATDYPARVVRWVVPFTPGASNDVTERWSKVVKAANVRTE